MDRLQQPRHPGRRDVRRVPGDVEADSHVALGGQIVNFFRLNFIQQPFQRTGITQIAVMKRQAL